MLSAPARFRPPYLRIVLGLLSLAFVVVGVATVRLQSPEPAGNHAVETTAGIGKLAIPRISGLVRATSMTYDVARRQTVLVTNRDGCQSETWSWDGRLWTLQHPDAAPAPACLWVTALGYDAGRGRVVLFASQLRSPGYEAPTRTTTWTWDGGNWSQESPATMPMLHPLGLAFHSATGRLVLVGQVDTLEVQTWAWDGRDWQRVSGPQPPFSIPSIAYDAGSRSIVAFDGAVSNETWSFDGKAWFRLARQPGGPDGIFAIGADRAGHVFLFGGPRGLWRWSGHSWARLTTSHMSGDPAARYQGVEAFMAADPGSGGLLFHGTLFYPSSPSGTETWVWDGKDWTRKACVVPTCGNST